MKKGLFFFGLALVFVFASCNKDNIDPNASAKVDKKVVFVTDQDALKDRIEIVNQPVSFGTKSTTDLDYTWLANIHPGEVNGVRLSAVTVDGYGDKAYIGWHAFGTDIYGELITVSLEIPGTPLMVQSASFIGQEFNDLEVKGSEGKLFAAGEAEQKLDGSSIGDNAAMAISFDVDVDGYVGNYVNWEHYLPGYSANSITYVANQTLWVSKGSQGGLTVFRDYDLDEVKLDMELSNAKHFDATGDWGVLLYGVGFNESKLIVWDMNSLYAPVAEYTIPYDVTPLGKNSVDINGDFAYLAMGNDGVVKVDLTDGSVINTFDYENGAFCNGVTVDWRYIFAAYGADGLFVLDKDTFEVLGNFNYDGSCNYVKKVGDYIYLANGKADGLVVLMKN
jgi:hypothetical protein